jgi:EmrB/QacA subfamily drug resistance transporter
VSPEPKTKPYLVLTVVGVGTLLSAMAGSMVNLALPDLGRDLAISIEDSRWVVQAFLLAVGALLLPAGRLGDLLGHRRVYLIGYTFFGVASLACGLAGSFTSLVVFRVLQGMGGAMALATSPALLTLSFPGKHRGRALGMQATATYVGLTVGPTLGGFIVSALGWRWTFYFYVPAALVILFLGLRFLPHERKEEKPKFDLAGALALLLGLPFSLLLLSECQRWGTGFYMTWLSAGVGATGLFFFILVQRRTASPLLDLNLFRSRMFTGASISAVANYIAMFAVTILMPFYLEEGLGKSPAVTGMFLSVQPLLMALVASPSGWLSDRLGSRGLATAGMLIMAVGLFGLSGLGPDSGEARVILWLATVGLGTGIFISPNSSALMGSAPRTQQGAAGAVLAESRSLGMFIGVAMATAIYHAAGGRTGAHWRPEDFDAMHLSLLAGSAAALLGALAASLRGKMQSDSI